MDWESILTNVMIGIVGGAASWTVASITKLRSDMNACFKKLRELEQTNVDNNGKYPDQVHDRKVHIKDDNHRAT